MKVTPLAQGTGVPQTVNTTGQTSPDRIARAKAVASGQTPEEVPHGTNGLTGMPEKAMPSIKMRTQVSTNRNDVQEVQPEIPKSDANESVTQQAAETKPLSPEIAAIVKTKRALQVKERELAQREQTLKSQAPTEQVDYKALLKANPLSVLQEAGVSYDDLTQAILNNQSAPIDPMKLRNELKEDLKKELLGEFDTRDQQAETQVLNEIYREAVELTSTGEDFEAIREAKAQHHIKDLIHRTWKQTGEVMDVREAATLVENQLIEDAIPFAKIKKVQSRLMPAQEIQVAQTPPVPKANTKVMRTLTNRDNATPVLDKRARAIAAFSGTLKRG